MKKILAFLTICAFALGSVGGFLSTVLTHSYLIAGCVIILAILAFPKVKQAYDELLA